MYRYDNAGNIILKDEHEYIYGEETATLSRKEYTYSDTGWKDKLISFGGQSITYDALGNPLNYLGHSLTWDRVRQLKTFDNNTFAYDGFGKRCRKNSVYYLYDGDKLIKERRNGTSLVYFYDTTGICGFRYHDFAGENDTTAYYFYLKNLQGDVTAILDQNGTVVAEYLYDAWGKCYITYDPTGIGAINPIRYRSYHYDTETGLYYLNSRYYDPNTGRFLNADMYVSTGQGILGNNMFAYCGNDPINRFDFFGTSWKHWFIGAAVVAACALATVATCGGFAAAATAVGMVASGGAAFTVSSTIAASAFIGASMSYGSAVCYSAFNSNSIEDFAESGNTDMIITTATAGALYSIAGYNTAKNQLPDTKKYSETTGTARPPKVSEPNSRYIQYDQNTGKVRTDAVYGNDGNLYSRVDYLHTHNINGVNVQPHIHFSPAINSQGLPVGRATVMPW